MTRRILLIEDDKSLSVAMRYMIENLGYDLIIAEDHEQATQAIEDGPYAAAIVDYYLHNVPSSDLIGELRKRYPTMPLVCSTAARMEQIPLDESAMRPDAFLYKPFAAQELRDVLTSLIA